MSKWATEPRQVYLVELWHEHGNKCLLGHACCPIPSHYQHKYTLSKKIVTAKNQPCFDANGNRIKFRDGSPSFLTVYPVKNEVETHVQTIRPYDLISEDLIKDWVIIERQQTVSDYQYEYSLRHNLKDRLPLAGQFSGIAKDIFYDNQSMYEIEALGVNGINFHPIAKVRIASSQTRLFVDLNDVLKPLSKNKRHKILRYAKNGIVDSILDYAVYKAVKDYLS